MKVAVIIPTYNECQNVRPLTEAILHLADSSGLRLHVIIVDDESPDGTGKIADQLAQEHPGQVHVIHRSGKQGLGSAYIAGFRHALAQGMDRICTMDADFSHHPAYLPALIALADETDIAIGSRYVPGGGTRNWGLQRQLLSWGANAFARFALGLAVHDCTAGFRCYRREVLESLAMEHIFSDGYSFLIEMLYKCQQAGWRVGETPIIFEDRRAGQSKISQREIFKALYTVLRLTGSRLLTRRKILRSRVPESSSPA